MFRIALVSAIWPVLEMGRNSVSPSTIAMIMACKTVINLWVFSL